MNTRSMSSSDCHETRFFRAAANYLASIPDTLVFEHAEPMRDVAELVIRLTPSTINGNEVGVDASMEVRFNERQHCLAPEGHWIGNTHRLYPLPPVRFEDLEIFPRYGGPVTLGRSNDDRARVSRHLGEVTARLRRASKREQGGRPWESHEIILLLAEARQLIEFDRVADATRQGGER